MSVTTVTLSDVPLLVPLINKSFNNNNGEGPGWTHSAHVISGTRLDPQDTYPQELITDNITATVMKYLEDDSHSDQNQIPDILGCVKLDVQEKESTFGKGMKVCHLGILCVSPDAQGKGIGKKLLEAADNWARSKSCCVMEISVVNERRDLITFYERNGYVKTGKTEEYPVIPGVREVAISGMELIILEKVL